jgi:hypothetical protein
MLSRLAFDDLRKTGGVVHKSRGLRLAVTDADDLRYLFCTGGPSL